MKTDPCAPDADKCRATLESVENLIQTTTARLKSRAGTNEKTVAGEDAIADDDLTINGNGCDLKRNVILGKAYKYTVNCQCY